MEVAGLHDTPGWRMPGPSLHKKPRRNLKKPLEACTGVSIVGGGDGCQIPTRILGWRQRTPPVGPGCQSWQPGLSGSRSELRWL